MLNNTQYDLIYALEKKTTAGAANWVPTEVGDQFSLRLKSGSVLFDRFAEPEQAEYYKLAVIDVSGNRVDEMFFVSSDDMYEFISSMFYLVRRVALGAEQTEKSILEELNSNDPVGSDDGPDLDSIPF